MTESIVQNTLVTVGLLFSSLNPQYPPIDSTTFYPGTTKDYYHVVNEGESFASISQLYYEDTSLWSAIWEDNTLEGGPNALEPGMRLLVRREKPKVTKKFATGYVQPIAVNAPASVITSTTQPITTPVSSGDIRPGATGPLSEAQINFLGNCESGMTATRNSGNGFYGAFQFMISTWNAMGTGYERADFAPLDVQIAAVQKLLSRSSIWTQFPGCAAKMRSVGLI